jgi:agmatinase
VAANTPREPGPISLRRRGGDPVGAMTLFGVPLCLDAEDLHAVNVDVAFVGAPVDMSIGHRGAAFGPRMIRVDETWPPYNPELLINTSTRIHPFRELTVVDYGDATVDPFSIENSLEPIRSLVRDVASAGAIPIVLGGDHSVLLPNAAAMADVYGAGNVGVLHFDAHPDCSENPYGHAVSHATPIRRLILDEHIPGRNFVQVGLRSIITPDDKLLAWMQEHGMQSHFMAEIDRFGFDTVLDRAIDETLDGPEYIYLSLDIDVLDPAFAPGTGTPEPQGLTVRELLPALRRICHETNVIGMEVVEVAPHLDPGSTTTLNARRAIFEAVTGIAMRKKGIQGRNYLDDYASGERFAADRPRSGER